MGAIDLLDREALRAAYAACVLKRPAHRTTFDMLFDLWFPAVSGDPSSFEELDGSPGEADDPPSNDMMRALLQQLLLDGDEEMMRRFARQAVQNIGRADTAPGRQSWFSYRVIRQL